MQSTRAKIIELLRRRPETTVEELTRELNLAHATVRRHLDVLQRDGKVETRAVRQASGRPHFAFTLTESGEAELGEHHIRITRRLVQELAALRAGDTRNRSGHDLASLVFERLAEGVIRSCAHRVTARRINERLPQALEALANEGVVFDMTPRAAGYLLEGRSCPCRRIRSAPHDACVYDRHLLESLLDAPVEPAVAESGGTGCAYFVRAGAS